MDPGVSLVAVTAAAWWVGAMQTERHMLDLPKWGGTLLSLFTVPDLKLKVVRGPLTPKTPLQHSPIASLVQNTMTTSSTAAIITTASAPMSTVTAPIHHSTVTVTAPAATVTVRAPRERVIIYNHPPSPGLPLWIIATFFVLLLALMGLIYLLRRKRHHVSLAKVKQIREDTVASVRAEGRKLYGELTESYHQLKKNYAELTRNYDDLSIRYDDLEETCMALTRIMEQQKAIIDNFDRILDVQESEPPAKVYTSTDQSSQTLTDRMARSSSTPPPSSQMSHVKSSPFVLADKSTAKQGETPEKMPEPAPSFPTASGSKLEKAPDPAPSSPTASSSKPKSPRFPAAPTDPQPPQAPAAPQAVNFTFGVPSNAGEQSQAGDSGRAESGDVGPAGPSTEKKKKRNRRKCRKDYLNRGPKPPQGGPPPGAGGSSQQV